jgi:outer membrane protein
MITALLLALAVQAQDTSRLTLQAVVDRALVSYPTVAAARAARDHAAADLADAHAARRPDLLLSGSLDRFQQPMVVAPLHGLDLRNLPLFDRTPYQAGVTLNWTVLDFGKRTAQVRAQEALHDAATDVVASTEQKLITSAVDAYLAVLDARELLAAQDRLVAALAAAGRQTLLLEGQGRAARVDVLRMDAELRRGQADRISAAARLDVAERSLARVSQIPYDEVDGATLPPLALSDTLASLDTSTSARATLARRARQTNATVRQLDERVRAADAGLVAARATRLPDLSMQGGFVDYGRWLGNYSSQWQIGIALSYPVYTGGSRTNGIQRAAADQRAAEAQVRAAELDVDASVDQALAALRESHARVSALQTAVAQSQEVERIERLALDVGTAVQTDYLDAEAKLFSDQANLIQARHAEIAARVDLARAVGELSRAWLARNVESLP